MAINQNTLKDFDRLKRVLKVLTTIDRDDLPRKLADVIDEVEEESGSEFRGIVLTLSASIGQQYRQVGWVCENGKWKHKHVTHIKGK